ncbi:hypothetical protein CFAM422_012252 [Trichoderma lentiforme]|uniref:Uncharacterized protein n=1 Tax=Trichoderma lentiforme TaxID=1567552 RepID=A0A9P5C7V0_9HYPO|nr:hypothetical protein CFAM422_012252 [Trichoderma lentiforme]
MALISTEFELPKETETGGTLRVTNRNGNEIQRLHIVDRSHIYTVQADLAEVVHGKYDDCDYGTLLAMDFNVINVVFGSHDGNINEGPGVMNISPKGHISMRPTTRQVEVKRSATSSVEGGGGPVTISAGLGWEKTYTEDQEAHTTLQGIIRYEGRRSGMKNAVRWVLSENPQRKSGAPSFLRGLILLKRTDMEKFIAVVSIDVSVSFGLSTIFRALFCKKEDDDPEIFDPEPSQQPRKSSWTDIPEIAVETLHSVEIGKLDVILTTTARENAVTFS